MQKEQTDCDKGHQKTHRWNDTYVMQGTPRIASTQQSLEKAKQNYLYRIQKEHGPVDISVLDFQPPGQRKDKSCCFKPPSLWRFVTAAIGN